MKRVFDWIWENRTWLFSGVGVVLLLVAIEWVSNKFFSTPQAVQVSPPSTAYSATPTPEDILSQIESLPLYQQDEAKHSYVGLRVTWRVRFLFLAQLRGGTYHVGLSYGDRLGCPKLTATHVNINDFPRLKIARQDELIQVTGEIEEITTPGDFIMLKDAKIDSPEDK